MSATRRRPVPSAQRVAAPATRSGTAAAPDITAVICTYNRHDLLLDAIHGLQAQTLDPERYEIIVVDNSTDLEARTEFWRAAPPSRNLRVLTEDIPGLSRARNIGMRAAAAPIIAYIDDDAVAVPEWLEALLGIFDTDQAVGIAGGPVEPIWPNSAPPWLHKWLQGFLTIVDLGPQPRMLKETEWLAGTNIAFRKAALESAGGFNEMLGRVKSTLLSNEELAVAKNIHDEGLISFYIPKARVFHRVHADRVSQAWMRRRASWQLVSDILTDSVQNADPQQSWNDLGDYLMRLPPEMRNARGLFYDTPDPELFLKQCRALGALMHLLLDSGQDPDPIQS
ncbi:MAG TPA: glycosyltransferase [Stellaceae bacterium]|nr:glycosyltransferase [Stellaceae bacterium]